VCRTFSMRVWARRIFLLAVMGCFLAFAYLFYHRWLVTEAAYGGPIEFAQLLGSVQPGLCSESMAHGTHSQPASMATSTSRSPCLLLQRTNWISIFLPLWVADGLTLCAHTTLLIIQHGLRPISASINARLEHASGACRAVLYALFKVLIVERLSSPSSPASLSWYLIFAPVYAAAALQAILHSFKTLEGGEALFRGRDASRPRRRPGFALTLDDTLAFNISLHLTGSFYVRHATWSVVFWPLWLVAAVCGVGLFLLICFGVPMLSRRYPTRQFLMVLPPLLLLLATYSLSMHALLRCIEWLDHPKAPVYASEVMSPAIAAAWCLWLLLAVVTLSAIWHVPPPSADQDDDAPREPPSWESLSVQMPSLLVRESSTLFRQVSARTLQAYKQRYGMLEEEGEDEDDEASHAEEGRRVPASPPSLQILEDVEGKVSEGTCGSPNLVEGHGTWRRVEPSDLLDGGGCWICLRDDVPAEAVLLQCGHGGICLGCAAHLWQRRAACPMCRAPIELVARVGDCMHVDNKILVSTALPPPRPATP